MTMICLVEIHFINIKPGTREAFQRL